MQSQKITIKKMDDVEDVKHVKVCGVVIEDEVVPEVIVDAEINLFPPFQPVSDMTESGSAHTKPRFLRGANGKRIECPSSPYKNMVDPRGNICAVTVQTTRAWRHGRGADGQDRLLPVDPDFRGSAGSDGFVQTFVQKKIRAGWLLITAERMEDLDPLLREQILHRRAVAMVASLKSEEAHRPQNLRMLDEWRAQTAAQRALGDAQTKASGDQLVELQRQNAELQRQNAELQARKGK